MKKHYILLLAVLLCSTMKAQDTKESASLGQAASNAVNPLAFVTKLQMQPNYTVKGDDATQFNLTMRIVQPTGTIGLPFIKSANPEKVYTLYRLEVPIIGQTFPNAPASNATGLSDLVVLDVIAFKQKWGFWGFGPNFMIPTASAPQLGSGKLSTGLTGTIVYKKKGLMLGILAQQYVSVAGDANRAHQNFMLFQPVINKVLKKGYFVGFTPIMKFDWENHTYNIPLSIQAGKAFAKNLSMFIAPEYVVSGPNKGDFTLRIQLNAMFPPGK